MDLEKRGLRQTLGRWARNRALRRVGHGGEQAGSMIFQALPVEDRRSIEPGDGFGEIA